MECALVADLHLLSGEVSAQDDRATSKHVRDHPDDFVVGIGEILHSNDEFQQCGTSGGSATCGPAVAMAFEGTFDQSEILLGVLLCPLD